MTPAAAPLTACLITRDAAATLPRCLESLRGLADALVVDTGSRDDTVRIAAARGATIVHHVWDNDFSRARNAAWAQVRSPWALWIDADEWMTEASRQWLTVHLRHLAARPHAVRILHG